MSVTTSNQAQLRAWLSNKLSWDMPENTYCIGQMKNDLIIGCVGFNCHINKSILIHSAGLDKAWITRGLLAATFDYPFNQLGCEILIGQVGSKNIASKRLLEHLGFKTVAVIKNAHEQGDLVIMTMSRDKCKYIRNKEEVRECAMA
jgi:RimJ/RimL family protein N-acetyltransferase